MWWRNHEARGDVIIVRFADNFVAGFQYQDDAERFLAALRERFAKFSLELHPGKTRLIEFGRFAIPRRKARGAGKPETSLVLVRPVRWLYQRRAVRVMIHLGGPAMYLAWSWAIPSVSGSSETPGATVTGGT